MKMGKLYTRQMTAALKTFAAVAAMIAGLIVLMALPYNGFFWDHAVEAFVGVILLAGGLTYFWKRSQFAK
ncbi:MAG: hypothetical protein DMG71_08010 [Acidobacteria bacterium]|nr:MAG: hypothetical protein DMG71_08010 [Acidobacteriota bacterium]